MEETSEKCSGKQKLINFIKDGLSDEIMTIKQDHERLRVLEYQHLKENFNVFAQEQLELVNLVMAHHGFITVLQNKQNKLKCKVLVDSVKENCTSSSSTVKPEDLSLSTTPTVDEQMKYVMQAIMGNCKERIDSLKSSVAATEYRRSSLNNQLCLHEDVAEKLASKMQSNQAAVALTESVGTTVRLKRKKKPYKILLSRCKNDSELKRADHADEENTKGEICCQTDAALPYQPPTAKIASSKTCKAQLKKEDIESPKSKSATSCFKIPPGFMTMADKRAQTNTNNTGGSGTDCNEKESSDSCSKRDGSKPSISLNKKENKPMETETVSRLFSLLDELKALSVATKIQKNESHNKKEESEMEDLVVNPEPTPTFGNLGQWKNY